MGDMNEYTEDTLRATVQAAELAIRDSEERGRLLAEMWQGLGLAADAGELLFQAPGESWREPPKRSCWPNCGACAVPSRRRASRVPGRGVRRRCVAC